MKKFLSQSRDLTTSLIKGRGFNYTNNTMSLSNPKYACLLITQLLLLMADLLINSLSLVIASYSNTALLVAFIIQDIFLFVSLVMIFVNFFNTFAFAAGLIGLLTRKFAWPLVVGVVYLIVTIGYHVWSLTTRWSQDWAWSDGQQFLYVVQKLIAVLYYYLYKRGMYRLSDRKLYEDSEWIRDHMRHRTH